MSNKLKKIKLSNKQMIYMTYDILKGYFIMQVNMYQLKISASFYVYRTLKINSLLCQNVKTNRKIEKSKTTFLT